ncbi:MAG: ECF transporter S component [Deltaproteobacteria bacterium]|uniref:ECF transporter S component n=1 Tax=Candidatus Zymogenus saltonus TaxID=2844893 RepID=A0A9D8KE45_9DELT|nr:ECF transporter S component [Candidatus Zymogenus saltonus]
MLEKGTKVIARTAILLALTAAIQIAGRYFTSFLGPMNMFIVGTLVNACLLISVEYAGIKGASVIAFVTPFTAVLTGAPVPIPFLPFIGIGNFILVLVFYLLKRRIYGIGVGAILKFSFLFASVAIFLKMTSLPAKLVGALYFAFSWPQIVTALLGGVVYLAVTRVLKVKSIDE